MSETGMADAENSSVFSPTLMGADCPMYQVT